MVEDGLFIGSRVGQIFHVPVKFFEQSGRFNGKIYIDGGIVALGGGVGASKLIGVGGGRILALA